MDNYVAKLLNGLMGSDLHATAHKFWCLTLTHEFYTMIMMHFGKIEKKKEQHEKIPAQRCSAIAHCQIFHSA